MRNTRVQSAEGSLTNIYLLIKSYLLEERILGLKDKGEMDYSVKENVKSKNKNPVTKHLGNMEHCERTKHTNYRYRRKRNPSLRHTKQFRQNYRRKFLKCEEMPVKVLEAWRTPNKQDHRRSPCPG